MDGLAPERGRFLHGRRDPQLCHTRHTVTAVLQTRDGYLWISTYSGQARFDGVDFTVFDELSTPALSRKKIGWS